MRRVVLVVDDNEINRLNIRLLLKDKYDVLEAGDISEAEAMLAGHRIDLVVLDLALPPEPDNPEIGMEYLQRLRKETPDIPVVVVTGHDERRLATRARRLGALDFFGKPFDPDEVRDTIEQAMEASWQRMREQELGRQLAERMGSRLLGSSAAIRQLRTLIEQVAPTPSTVLIRGETGSGKELVARLLHARSERSGHPFIPVNCVAISAEHLESELFGHEKGAFAGATRRTLGWFERASGGTLFLDEVAGLPASVQGKLLRVLESGEFSRLGGEAVLHCDIRLLCSTKQPLEALVQKGEFREDLYYRIHVVDIEVPPLRAHIEDIPELANYFLERKALLCNKHIDDISEDVMRELMNYDWPGNVRELENVIERAVVLATSGTIDTLPPLTRVDGTPEDHEDLLAAWLTKLPDDQVNGDALIEEFERQLVLTALKRNHGVKARAGRWLGFADKAKDRMRYLCNKHGIQPQEDVTS